MKIIFTCLLLLQCLCGFCQAFDSSNVVVGKIGGPDDAETWFRVQDDASEKFVNSLFILYPEAKRKNYTHRFRNVSVRGIESALILRVNEGIYFPGSSETSTPGYFHTFTSKRYRAARISKMTDKEGFGVTIYVKKEKGDKKYIYTKEEAKAFVAFIYTLLTYKPHD